jgi:hypothetical protein
VGLDDVLLRAHERDDVEINSIQLSARRALAR